MKVLPPGVQDAEKSNLGSHVLRIGGDFQQCGRAALEQEAV
jgi:hypothetical protein